MQPPKAIPERDRHLPKGGQSLLIELCKLGRAFGERRDRVVDGVNLPRINASRYESRPKLLPDLCTSSLRRAPSLVQVDVQRRPDIRDRRTGFEAPRLESNVLAKVMPGPSDDVEARGTVAARVDIGRAVGSRACGHFLKLTVFSLQNRRPRW